MKRTLLLCSPTIALLALACAGADDGQTSTAVGSEMPCVPGGSTVCPSSVMTGATEGPADPAMSATPPPVMGDAMNSDGMTSAGEPTEPEGMPTDTADPVEDDPVAEPADPEMEDPVMEEPMVEEPPEEEPEEMEPEEEPVEEEPVEEEMPDDVVEEPELVTGEVPEIEYCANVSSWEATWSQWEDEVLLLVNEERAQGADCGSMGSYDPAEPLTMDPLLRCTARVHSLDMFERGFFDHYNPDGDGPGERLDAAEYMGSTWGENIAQGYPSPEEVVQGWMDSDGHCSNIMAAQFSLLGVGYYAGEDGERFSRNAHYWTQNFGAPPRDFGGGR